MKNIRREKLISENVAEISQERENNRARHLQSLKIAEKIHKKV